MGTVTIDKEMYNLITTKYEDYSNEFEAKLKECKSVTEMLHTYASYAGKLQALMDGICIQGV